MARRGEGARLGSAHVIPAITATDAFRTNLLLCETSGNDRVRVKATLYDGEGRKLGETRLSVPRYGLRQVNGVVTALGGSGDLRAGRLELEVDEGAGAALGLVTVIDNQDDDAVTYTGRPLEPPSDTSSVAQRNLSRLTWAKAVGTVKVLIPAIVNGYTTFPGTDRPYAFRSELGLTAGTLEPTRFRLVYSEVETGRSIEKTVEVGPRRTRVFGNVAEELFGIAPGARSNGPVLVETDGTGLVWSKVWSDVGSGTLGDAFPTVPLSWEGLTSVASRVPIVLDGLEQSLSAERGTRSNLLLNEVAGKEITVTVRLYEAGNRSRAIAERDVSVPPLAKVQLSTVFRELGLDLDERRKERTNVLCVVEPKSGEGILAAVVTTIDNRTGDTRNALLVPGGGTPASGPGVGIGR